MYESCGNDQIFTIGLKTRFKAKNDAFNRYISDDGIGLNNCI